LSRFAEGRPETTKRGIACVAYSDPHAGLTSVADAVATWPETATAVAVRLQADDTIDVCATCGMTDLLDGRLAA
jgi:hypothetical protein